MLLSHFQNIGNFFEAFLDLIVMVLNLIKSLKNTCFCLGASGFAWICILLAYFIIFGVGVLGCARVCWGVLGCARVCC